MQRVRKAVLWCLVTLFVTSCDPAPHGNGVTRLELPDSAVEVEAKQRSVKAGQLLYLPCYSQVYLLDGRPYNLAITLSLRNTSTKEKLIISSVAYHNRNGELVKELCPKEVELAPLSVAEVFVHEEDKSGGSGASFLIRWCAEKPISAPVVEAAMVGSSGALGVSFLTTPVVLEELEPSKEPLAPPKSAR